MTRGENLFVLTGASGSGKSSILAALQQRGFRCVEEIGRQVVREQIERDGTATPWQDHPAFMRALLARSDEAYRAAEEQSAPVFFDRALPECVSFVRTLDAAEREHWLARIESSRYNRLVFVTPPWPEIYRTDAERRHSFEQGVRGHEDELASYRECGYTLLEVPRDSIESRAEFIIGHALQ
jgi:predicted ATPase